MYDTRHFFFHSSCRSESKGAKGSYQTFLSLWGCQHTSPHRCVCWGLWLYTRNVVIIGLLLGQSDQFTLSSPRSKRNLILLQKPWLHNSGVAITEMVCFSPPLSNAVARQWQKTCGTIACHFCHQQLPAPMISTGFTGLGSIYLLPIEASSHFFLNLKFSRKKNRSEIWCSLEAALRVGGYGPIMAKIS